jgi:hypothetical protein
LLGVSGRCLCALALWRTVNIIPLMKRGLLGACLPYFSFGSIMVATRVWTKIGEAAVLRETSTVLRRSSALILKSVEAASVCTYDIVALGAVIVEVGG